MEGQAGEARSGARPGDGKLARTPRRSSSAVTLRNVAARAGVSAMSVSNVLNGRTVSPATREAVRRAIDELHYVPNQAARVLARAAPMCLGLVHANDEHPLSSALLTGALTEAARLGVQLLLHPITFSHLHEVGDAVRTLRERGVEGVILPQVFGEALDGDQRACRIGAPIVCVGPATDLANVSCIRIDDLGAARSITAMLIGIGHRRIGFLRAPAPFAVRETRYGGYRAALEEAGLAIDPALVVDAAFTFQEGLIAAETLLNLPDPPTAIFASNNEMAAGVLAAAHLRKIAVPDALAVAGFEDSYIAQTVWPPLTSVRIPMAEMAGLAVRRLVQEGRGAGEPTHQTGSVVVDYRIMVRGSTQSP